VPEHTSIADRQLSIFVGGRKRFMKNLVRKYVKDNLFTEISNFGFSEFQNSSYVRDIKKIHIYELRIYQKI